MRYGVLLFLLSIVCAPLVTAQNVSVVVRVLADEGPLANAEVIDRSSGARALTRSSGDVLVRVNNRSRLSLRVRQLGFAYQDIALRASDLLGGGRDTVIVRLERVAFAMPAVATVASSQCPRLDQEHAQLGYYALTQLREGAERYATFSEAYPFRVLLERRTSMQFTGYAWPSRRVSRERVLAEEWGEPYSHGNVMFRDQRGFAVPVLSVRALGDPEFWAHHCITAAFIEGEPDNRRVRLEFVPSPSVRDTDWAGSAVIDSATSVLQRLDFQLLVRQRGGPRRLEGYTTFRSPSPLISIPDSTAAIWWYHRPDIDEPWGPPNMVQVIRVEKVQYRKQTPPSAAAR